jgi:hypothetical protein
LLIVVAGFSFIGTKFFCILFPVQMGERAMADETFAANLMRAVVAELHVLNLQNASREMLGRSYFSLGIGDKMAVDQVVLALVAGNYSGVTAEWLAGPQPSQQPAGFGIPAPTPPQGEKKP